MRTHDGGNSKTTQRRMQAGAAAWRRVEGIIWDRKLEKQLKGKVLEACVVPACIYGLGTLALTKRHDDKMQIAENNWVRRICKATQVDRRKMKELREEIGMKKHLKMKVAGSRMIWAGHVQRMGEDRLSKTAWKAEGEEEDQSCDRKTVSNGVLKGQVRTAKSGRPSQKTEGDGEH